MLVFGQVTCTREEMDWSWSQNPSMSSWSQNPSMSRLHVRDPDRKNRKRSVTKYDD
jgi:hypothetical protein